MEVRENLLGEGRSQKYEVEGDSRRDDRRI